MDTQKRLVEHLRAERDCLRELRDLARREAEALRHLRHSELLAIAADTARVVERHVSLVEERGPRFAPFGAPETLTELQARLPAAPAAEVGTLQREMSSLSAEISSLREHNQRCAAMGREAIEDVLDVVRKRQAGTSTTYGGDGKVVIGERSHRLWRMG